MKLSYRIGKNCWDRKEDLDVLLEVVRRWKGAVDEIALFVDYSHHGYYPIEEYEALAPVLKERMQAIRDAGVPSVGINVLCSIGHLDEGFDWLTRPPFQTLVGHDGSTSTSCMCMRAPEYLPYLQKKYAVLASSAPDFIWVDDDVRMQNHHVNFPCFCHNCVETFNRRIGAAYRRESLVAALDADREGTLRRQFLDYNREALQTLLKAIREAVRGVDPRIRLGLMTSGIPWNSYAQGDLPGMLKALGAEMIRPGGGFYTDEQPAGTIGKAVEVSLQSALAPGIPDNQYELEDFPDCARKSVHIHLLEFTTALMAGCSGIAVDNVVSPWMPPKIMDTIEKTRPLWDRLTAHAKGMKLRGYCPVCVADCDSAPGIRHSIFSGGASRAFGNEASLTGAGIAWTPLPEDAEVCVLSGDTAAALPEEQLLKIFAKGVILDTDALEQLATRGHADLAGCVPGKGWHSGLVERYAAHPVNGASEGIVRNVFMNFWDRGGITVRELEPMPGAEVLSTFESITGVPLNAAASTVFQNRLGGRVAVLGYFPWRFLEVPGKRDTMPALLDHLAGGRFPVQVIGSKRVTPMVRTAPDGSGFAAWLLNTCFDPAEGVSLRLDADCGTLEAWDTYGAPVDLPQDAVRRENGFLTIRLPAIAPWNGLLLLGK